MYLNNTQYKLKFKEQIKAMMITFEMTSEWINQSQSYESYIEFDGFRALSFERLHLQLRTEAKVFPKLNLKS